MNFPRCGLVKRPRLGELREPLLLPIDVLCEEHRSELAEVMLQLAGAIQQLSDRIFAVSERVAQLERANGHEPTNGQAQPAPLAVTARPEPRIY